jgi:hypothetical protein
MEDLGGTYGDKEYMEFFHTGLHKGRNSTFLAQLKYNTDMGLMKYPTSYRNYIEHITAWEKANGVDQSVSSSKSPQRPYRSEREPIIGYASVGLAGGKPHTSPKPMSKPTSKSSSPQPKPKDSSAMQCYKCGKMGHIARECRNGKPASGAQSNRTPPRNKPTVRYVDDIDDIVGSLVLQNDLDPTSGENTELICAVLPTVGEHKTYEIIFDTGATCHVIKDIELITEPIDCDKVVKTVSGEEIQVNLQGTTNYFGGAYFIPESTTNILSMSQLVRSGYQVKFIDGCFQVGSRKDKNDPTLCSSQEADYGCMTMTQTFPTPKTYLAY